MNSPERIAQWFLSFSSAFSECVAPGKMSKRCLHAAQPQFHVCVCSTPVNISDFSVFSLIMLVQTVPKGDKAVDFKVKAMHVQDVHLFRFGSLFLFIHICNV